MPTGNFGNILAAYYAKSIDKTGKKDSEIYKKANIPGITKATSVYQALKKGLINVVCVGDAIHTEKNTVLRWEKAHEDFVNGKKTGKYMCQEMKDCFNTLLCLMLLKIKFPEHFQSLSYISYRLVSYPRTIVHWQTFFLYALWLQYL